MKPGAYYVISGIINTAENDVKQALNENGFKILETMHMNDWVGFVATKG
jgi:ribosomal protein L11 methyltransferase